MATITPALLAEIKRSAGYLCFDEAKTVLALVAALEEAQRERDALRVENEKLREALIKVIHDIDDLVGNSHGVCGLHLNGDEAPWTDITDGGRYEAWLSLDHARAALKETTHAD